MLGGFLDIRKREIAVGFADVLDLIETCDRVADVACVGQRFLALFRKGVDAVGQIALGREPAGFLVRFKGGFHGCDPTRCGPPLR